MCVFIHVCKNIELLFIRLCMNFVATKMLFKNASLSHTTTILLIHSFSFIMRIEHPLFETLMESI